MHEQASMMRCRVDLKKRLEHRCYDEMGKITVSVSVRIFVAIVVCKVSSVIIVIRGILRSVSGSYTVLDPRATLRELLRGPFDFLELGNRQRDPHRGLGERPGNVTPTVIIKCDGDSRLLAGVGFRD